jgi:hypothetical protein
MDKEYNHINTLKKLSQVRIRVYMYQTIYTTSKLVLRNLVEKSITILDVPIRPHTSVDLFKFKPNLSESQILDALKAPNGTIYNEIRNGSLALVELCLFTLSNTELVPSNILAVNPAFPGAILTLNQEGSFIWISPTKYSIDVGYPLYMKDQVVVLDKASETTSGYLSKEDYSALKQKLGNIRVWQYQDFLSIDASILHISKFENKEMMFSEDRVVSGSAFLVSKDNLEKMPEKKVGFFKKNKIKVNQHIGAQVVLSDIPVGPCRLYFLAILDDKDQLSEYEAAPRIVVNNRINFLDMYDFHLVGSQVVLGDKSFKGSIDSPKIKAQVLAADRIESASFKLSGGTDGFSLMSGPLGESYWGPNPAIGNTPPSHTYPGQLWIYQDELYLRDSKDTRWLSMETLKYVAYLDKEKNQDCYFAYQGMDMGRHNFIVPGMSILSKVVITSKSHSDWKLGVLVNGQQALDLDIKSPQQINELSLDLPKDARVQLYLSGVGIDFPIVECFFRKRV